MKTRDSQRMQDVEAISRAIRTYWDDYKVYPEEATGEGKMVQCGEKGGQVCEWGKSTIRDKYNVVYMNLVPGDPLTSKGYHYVYIPDAERQHFRIYIALEYDGDARVKPDLTIQCGNRVQCNWYVQE